MAKVQGIREKLHWPLYDAFVVPEKNGTPAPTFASEMAKRDARILRFFVDVQNKTRLETNLQASGTLPSLNAYEIRAMRVVVSTVFREPPKRGQGVLVSETDNVLADLIYNSVTSLLVGEKTMIEMPTYYFPAGAGVSPGNQDLPSHGQPDPMATFRFSEPVQIEPSQNFRVEILFPQGVPKTLGSATGPLRLWVVLDGYLTRDVQ